MFRRLNKILPRNTKLTSPTSCRSVKRGLVVSETPSSDIATLFQFTGDLPSPIQWEYEIEDNTWIPYPDELNIIIQHAYLRGEDTLWILLPSGDDESLYHDLAFNRMQYIKNDCGIEHAIRKTIRHSLHSNIVSIIYQSEDDVNQEYGRLFQYLNSVSDIRHCNAGVLHNAFRFTSEEHIVINSASIPYGQVALLYIEQFPQCMRGYAMLCQAMEMQNVDRIQLLNGEMISFETSLSTSLKFSSGDVLGWFLLWELKAISTEQRILFRRNAIELCEAWGEDCVIIIVMENCFQTISPEDDAKYYLKAINKLRRCIDKHQISQEKQNGKLFFSYIHAQTNLNNMFEFLLHCCCELAAILRAHSSILESINIGRTKTISTDSLLQEAKQHSKQFWASRIYLVKGVDASRNAWYYILVTGSIKHFKECLDDDIIQLADHGEILHSAYGDEAPPDVTNKLKDDYCICSTGYLKCSLNQLKQCLQHIEHKDCLKAFQYLCNANPALIGNPFLRGPTLEQVNTMYQSASSKNIIIPTWTSEEPYQSYKTALIMYTMDTPYKLYNLINTPLNVKYPMKSSLTFHAPVLALLCRALRALPPELQYEGTMYRGIRVESKSELLSMVDEPKDEFRAGTILTFPALTSASKSKDVAMRFADRLLFKMSGFTGYNIESLSQFVSELEILLHPPIFLEVLSWKRENNVIIVNTKPASKKTSPTVSYF